MRTTRLAALACLLALGSFCDPAQSEEFRIETKVFAGENAEPVSENTTLFKTGVVYDFLADPPQIAVFKKSVGGKSGRFILLDPVRERRAELTTDQISEFLARLNKLASESVDPLLKFAAAPNFDVAFDSRRGELTLMGDAMSYRLLTIESRSPQASGQYREFSDWYARLAVMLHPGASPSAPRLAVNAALAEHQSLPREVHLTIPAHKPYRKHEITVRSEHRVAWRHSQDDAARIDQANRHLVNFEQVDFEAFRHAE